MSADAATTTNSQLPPYLLECLHNIARSEGFAHNAYTIQCADGSKNGDGFIASIVSVTIRSATTESDAAHRSLSLVCKLLSDNERRRQFFSGTKLFAREAQFYNKIVPALKQFQADHGLDASTGFFAFPHCYAARADEQANEFYIVMDDVRRQQYALCDQRSNRPLTVDHVRTLFEQLGRLHGLSFAMRDQQPHLFEELGAELDDIVTEMIKGKFARQMFMDAHETTLALLQSEEHLRIMRRLTSNMSTIWKKCLSREAADRWAVIGHGDCWNNNLMFRGNGEVRFVDWQMSRLGSPALDLTFFLFTSTDRQMRAEHMHELLRHYHVACAGLMRACGSDADRWYTFDDVMQQVRLFGGHALTVAPTMIGVMVSEPENIMDMDEYANAMDAALLGAGDMAPAAEYFVKFDERSGPKFVERLGDVFDEAIRLKCVDEL